VISPLAPGLAVDPDVLLPEQILVGGHGRKLTRVPAIAAVSVS
jgi:hypothetical protein